MDNSTLITIVVTAVVTATAKWLVSLIGVWLKTKVMEALESRTLRLCLSKQALGFLVDGAVLMAVIFHVLLKFEGTSPATMDDLHNLFAYCVLVSILIAVAAYDGIQLRRFYASQA